MSASEDFFNDVVRYWGFILSSQALTNGHIGDAMSEVLDAAEKLDLSDEEVKDKLDSAWKHLSFCLTTNNKTVAGIIMDGIYRFYELRVELESSNVEDNK